MWTIRTPVLWIGLTVPQTTMHYNILPTALQGDVPFIEEDRDEHTPTSPLSRFCLCGLMATSFAGHNGRVWLWPVPAW